MRPSDLQIRYQTNMTIGNLVALSLAVLLGLSLWLHGITTPDMPSVLVPPTIDRAFDGSGSSQSGDDDGGFRGGWINRDRLRIIGDRQPPATVSVSSDMSTNATAESVSRSLVDITPRYTAADLGKRRGGPAQMHQLLLDKAPMRIDHGLFISHFEPPLPIRRAKRYGLTGGRATVELVLDSTGSIQSIQTVSETPPGYDLGMALEERLRACRYTMPVVAGRSVGMTVRITYDYSRPGPLEVSTSGEIAITLR